MKFAQSRKKRPGDAMVPLINVVFLLMIFFMLAGVIEAAPPFAIAAPETRSESEADNGPAIVFLSSDGQVAMSAEVMGLDAVLVELGRLNAKDKTLKIMVKADARAAFQDLKALTRSLHGAGFTSVTLLAAKGGS